MTGAEVQLEASAIRATVAPAVAEACEALRGIVEALGDPTTPGAADRIVEARGIVSALLPALLQDVGHAGDLAGRVKAAGLAKEGGGAPALWRFHLARRLLRRVRIKALGDASDPRLAEAVRDLATTVNAMQARVKASAGE